MTIPRIVAFVMAGGEGTRLRPLTEDCPKPALPFAGGCRIIDFVLSNLYNSAIRRGAGPAPRSADPCSALRRAPDYLRLFSGMSEGGRDSAWAIRLGVTFSLLQRARSNLQLHRRFQ